MRKAGLAVVFALSIAGSLPAQEIFFDDFEWGSICAWSNDRWYADFDEDGFGDSEDPGVPSDCPAPVYLVSNNFDCDDYAGEVYPGAAELCDGVDNDCEPITADGSGDPLAGTACDGSDSDLCEEGVFACDTGSLICSDSTGSDYDVCNGVDDDCDPASPDGSEDPLNGTACDGSDSDLCEEGFLGCEAGSMTCSDNTGNLLDVCDGADNDCDAASPDGSEDPSNGAACDGSDSDLCKEGTFSCEAGSLTCSDNTGSTYDVCNGADDDCDPASPDGSEDPLNNTACDGSDSDLCKEGTFSCEAGSLTCSDNTGNLIDVCDGADNDCDPASADGSEDPLTGAPCDGFDSDLCDEGTYSCVAGSFFCSDATGDDVEICDGLDNDCDGAADEDWSCSVVADGCCPPSCGPSDDSDCCEAQACSMISDLCCPSSCSSADDVDC